MEPVGGRYCITPTLAQPLVGGGTLAVPAWYPAHNLASRPTYPRMGDQAVPAGHIDALPQRGQTTCSGSRRRSPSATAAATDDELAAMIGAAKAALGSRLFVLGHHYQRDDVMRWADARGDSFGLSRIAADQADAEFIVFCGVHFMAESADVLTGDHQQVVLPDLNAGCSMADMADIDQVEEAWDELARVIDVDGLIPVTYMNSAAALKAFVGATAAPCARRPTPGPCSPGPSSGASASSSSRTSIWAATPATSSATAPTTCASGTRARPWAA